MTSRPTGTYRGNRNSSSRRRENGRGALDNSRQPQMKKVGNFLIDMDRHLGSG